MKKKTTRRGFRLFEFKDNYGANCSLQKSSLATEDCIWLGIDDDPKRHHVTGEWLGQRMHLSRGQINKLLPILKKFVKTGELP